MSSETGVMKGGLNLLHHRYLITWLIRGVVRRKSGIRLTDYIRKLHKDYIFQVQHPSYPPVKLLDVSDKKWQPVWEASYQIKLQK